MAVVDVERKVTAGGLGGALTIVVIWILTILGVDVPGTVGAAFATIFGVAAGYLTPNA